MFYPTEVILYAFYPVFRTTKLLGNTVPNSKMQKPIETKQFP